MEVSTSGILPSRENLQSRENTPVAELFEKELGAIEAASPESSASDLLALSKTKVAIRLDQRMFTTFKGKALQLYSRFMDYCIQKPIMASLTMALAVTMMISWMVIASALTFGALPFVASVLVGVFGMALFSVGAWGAFGSELEALDPEQFKDPLETVLQGCEGNINTGLTDETVKQRAKSMVSEFREDIQKSVKKGIAVSRYSLSQRFRRKWEVFQKEMIVKAGDLEKVMSKLVKVGVKIDSLALNIDSASLLEKRIALNSQEAILLKTVFSLERAKTFFQDAETLFRRVADKNIADWPMRRVLLTEEYTKEKAIVLLDKAQKELQNLPDTALPSIRKTVNHLISKIRNPHWIEALHNVTQKVFAKRAPAPQQ